MQSDPGSGVPHTGDDDEVWRDLVARLEEPDDSFLDAGLGLADLPDAPANPSAAAGDQDAKGVADFDPLGVWRQQAALAPHEPAAPERPGAPGPRDYAVEDDGEGEFVPEELPSLRNSDPAIMVSWIGAAGGPLFLVFASIFWRQAPLLLVIGVIMAFIAGTGYLLYRLPNSRDHDGGDGAVV